MKILSIKFAFIMALILSLNVLSLGQKVEDSVVDVLSGSSIVGVGFVWPDKNHIVTALHVVAGRSSFKVKSYTPGQKGIYAVESVTKILKEADLALLKLAQPIDVPIMRISNENPEAGNTYRMYRTTPGGGRIAGFTKRLEPEVETLEFYIGKNKPKLYNALLQQGYPQLTVKIARVVDPIKKGDSGSPICNTKGELIGIIDGGLYEGLRDYNWAIIASEYLDDLNDPLNDEKFSSVSETNPNIYLVSEDIAEEKQLDFGNSVLEKTFTTTIQDINKTLDLTKKEISDDNKFYDDILVDTGLDLRKHKVDIYQDANSGASIAVPSNLQLTISNSRQNNLYLYASSPSGNVKMIFSLQNNLQYSEVHNNNFINELLSLDFDTNWEKDHEMTDEYFEDKYSSCEYVYFNDDDGEATVSLLYSFNNFMGLGAYTIDYENPSKEDDYYYELFRECILLSDFPVY
jgi:hypothetical protein